VVGSGGSSIKRHAAVGRGTLWLPLAHTPGQARADPSGQLHNVLVCFSISV
jgi:hypothetical protein